ncbi:130_t:CDS:1, partial [Paraglomus occultum]
SRYIRTYGDNRAANILKDDTGPALFDSGSPNVLYYQRPIFSI